MLPDLTLALLGEDADLSDRERLALGFGILRERGWFAPTEWSTSMCCTRHGWTKITTIYGLTAEEWIALPHNEEPLTIWWTVRADNLAFCGMDDDPPMSESMQQRLSQVFEESGGSDAALHSWLSEHSDEVEIDERIERVTNLVNLRDELTLFWSGGMERAAEAVDVLRSAGLRVSEPTHPDETIIVHPRVTPLAVRPRPADRCIAVWFHQAALSAAESPQLALSREDAQRLIGMLQTALDGLEETG